LVVNFTHGDWQALCELYEGEASFIPTRGDGKGDMDHGEESEGVSDME
jgi:hypothetical protein